MHYDKMLWMMGGMSIAIYQGAQANQRQEVALARREVSPGEI
jgi:hypothetical protein